MLVVGAFTARIEDIVESIYYCMREGMHDFGGYVCVDTSTIDGIMAAGIIPTPLALCQRIFTWRRLGIILVACKRNSQQVQVSRDMP